MGRGFGGSEPPIVVDFFASTSKNARSLPPSSAYLASRSSSPSSGTTSPSTGMGVVCCLLPSFSPSRPCRRWLRSATTPFPRWIPPTTKGRYPWGQRRRWRCSKPFSLRRKTAFLRLWSRPRTRDGRNDGGHHGLGQFAANADFFDAIRPHIGLEHRAVGRGDERGRQAFFGGHGSGLIRLRRQSALLPLKGKRRNGDRVAIVKHICEARNEKNFACF